MKTHTISLINAVILVAFGAWGYFASDNPSPTALIPAIFGAALLGLNNGIKKENKVISHIAVVLTFLVFLGLTMPFKGVIGRGDVMGIFRVSTMLATTLGALIVFINSFIQARKAKKAS